MPPDKSNVLVVDDERIVADTLVTILRINGFDAIGVYSAEDAIVMARSSLPQTVVCDIILGGPMNGIDVAIQIRAFCPNTRIILTSGIAESSDLLEKARSEGHEFEVLGKPFHPTLLIEKLRVAA